MQNQSLTLQVPSLSLHERALYDIWAFADLIGFRSEARQFYPLHYEMAESAVSVNRTPKDTVPLYCDLRRICLVPRDHRKSTVVNTLYVMWRIYRNPEIRILVACNVKELAMAFISELRMYFEDEELAETVWNKRPHVEGRLVPLFRRSFDDYRIGDDEGLYDVSENGGEELVDNRKRKWTNYKLLMLRKSKAKEPTVMALSVGQRVTGQHYDLVILDDVVDLYNSDSPEKAKKISTWFDDIAANVLSKKPVWTQVARKFGEWVGSELQLLGTRYFSWDLYSSLVEPPDYEHAQAMEDVSDIDMPTYIAAMETYAREVSGYSLFFRTVYVNNKDASDGYICPEIFDEGAEANIKRTLQDAATFYSQYCNVVVNSLTAKLAPYRVTMALNYTQLGYGYARFFEHRELDPVTRKPQPYDVLLYLVVDLAISQSKRADLSCALVGGFDERGVLHIIDGIDGRFTVNGFINECWKLLDKWSIKTIYYEGGVGYQDAFGEAFKRTFTPEKFCSVVSLPVRRDVSKQMRIRTTLPPLLDESRLAVSSNVQNSTHVREQFTLFGKLNAKDDVLDVIEKIASMAKPTRQTGGDRSNVVSFATANRRYGGYSRRRR